MIWQKFDLTKFGEDKFLISIPCFLHGCLLVYVVGSGGAEGGMRRCCAGEAGYIAGCCEEAFTGGQVRVWTGGDSLLGQPMWCLRRVIGVAPDLHVMHVGTQ
jgi:hypothetical protein